MSVECSRFNNDYEPVLEFIDMILQEHADTLYRAFETHKSVFFDSSQTATELHKIMLELLDLKGWTHVAMPHTRLSQSVRAVTWCIEAHSMLLAPWATVQLKLFRYGANEPNQFAIFAIDDIPSGRIIYELIGQLSLDNVDGEAKKKSTQLSEMKARDGTNRVLYGPIRMVNHSCDANTVYEELKPNCRSTIIVRTLRAIRREEQITVGYGSDFFDADDDCLCSVCRPDTQHGVKSTNPSGMRIVDAEKKKGANKTKNRRRRWVRKHGKDIGKGHSLIGITKGVCGEEEEEGELTEHNI
ncbi:hypothetical protein R3P38DRAFT_3173291 [Favolaschia claudopus]|uniref:SET domain-containing protein n=1 Tax=Favolaschia claudopus TaxID=2862362 RepID=A0AAW0DF05_9AGAR